MSIKAKKFDSFDEFDFQPGSYCIMEDGHIFATLPCGGNFYNREGKWREENLNDESKVTLHPSINCHPFEGHRAWHGWLRNGYFVDA